MGICRNLASEKDKTVVVTLHNLEMAVKYSDSMVFMNERKIILR